MFKGLINIGAYTANADIPISTSIATNNKVELNGNSIRLMSPGLKDIKANVVFVPSVTGIATLRLYADGVAIPGAISSMNVTGGDTYTFNINDVVRVIRYINIGYASLSLRFDVDGTLGLTGETNAGTVIVEHLS